MPKYFSLIFCLVILCTLTVAAQDKIQTDRPDQTEAATLTSLHYFQGEFGLGKEDYGDNNFDLIHPTYLLKYGLSKSFELRLENQLITHYEQQIPNPKITTGFTPVEIGFRVALLEQKKLIPTTALIVQAAIPTFASPAFKAKHVAPSIKLAMENEVTKSYSISYNLGAEWDGFSTKPEWIYSLSNGFDLSEKWEAFAEFYGSVKRNQHPENNIDGGVGYYISNNIKIDAYGGFGISKAASDYIFGAGFSFRFK